MLYFMILNIKTKVLYNNLQFNVDIKTSFEKCYELIFDNKL